MGGQVTYTPKDGFSGTDSFTYYIRDVDGDTDTATVLIHVDGVPVAKPDTVTTRENTPVSGNLSDNDIPSEDGGNVWSKTTDPSNGTVVVNPDGTFIYTPKDGFTGTDSFTYTITDKDGDTSTTTVTIVVGENGVPIARPDKVSTPEDTPISGDLTGNDTPSPDGGNIWTLEDPPTHGTVIVTSDGKFTYTPDKGFRGEDSFTYTITDKDGDTSTTTVTIVVGENGVPIARPDKVSTPEDTPISGDLAGNDTPSPDGGNIWTLETPPTHGTVVITPDGKFTYTPDPGFIGEDSFTYTITDKDGDTSTATVTIKVGEDVENGVPIARPDKVTTPEDTPISGDLAGNDTPSPDGGNIWTLEDPPTHGTVIITPDGKFTYTPDPGFIGEDTFTYTITDKDGDTSTATVTIRVGLPDEPGHHDSGRNPGVSPRPTGPGDVPGSPGLPDPGPWGPQSEGGYRPPATGLIVDPGLTGDQRIWARTLNISEQPRRMEVAYVQWIDVWSESRQQTTIDVPPEVFTVLTGTEIRAEARLADGSPLPAWIRFDLDSRALYVDPPLNLAQKSLTVKLWFWDERGNESVAAITLNLEKNPGDGLEPDSGQDYYWETEQNYHGEPGQSVDISLPLEVQHTQVLTGQQIKVTATMADGSPLPEGLELDERTGEVIGQVPVGAEETILEIKVMAVDELGNRSEVIHHVRVAPQGGLEAELDMPVPTGRMSFSAQLAACLLV